MTRTCPCCGLRFAHAAELDDHAQDHLARQPFTEGRETLVAHRRREDPPDHAARVVHLPH